MTTTFEDAKVGDRVWALSSGWGTVVDINKYRTLYPIQVSFGLTTCTYTTDGKSFIDHISQALFWDEVVITPPEKPLPKLEVDTKVLVWDYPSREPTRGYFSHFSKNGKIATFSLGRTSWSIEKEPTLTWEYWELAKDNKCQDF